MSQPLEEGKLRIEEAQKIASLGCQFRGSSQDFNGNHTIICERSYLQPGSDSLCISNPNSGKEICSNPQVAKTAVTLFSHGS